MAEIINMPRLSDTMEEGTVAKWHKKVGDKVDEGDLLAEIETDKATMDFESFQEGTILYIGIEEGDTAPVDSVLAIVGDEGEEYESLLKGGSPKEGSSDTSNQQKESNSDTDAEEKEEETSSGEQTETQEKPAPEKNSTQDSDKRLKISPLARKLADEKGLDPAKIKGSGEGGRIVKRDIDKQQAQEPAKESAPATRQPAPMAAPEGANYEEVNVSQMRKTIARRLADSKFSAPHFYLTIEIDMDNAIKARKEINELAESKVSFNDFVIKAAAGALQKHPMVNSSWLGDKIRKNHDINIGVAVAVEEGLLVPVVRHANRKGLSTINAEVKTAAQKAHDKKLQPEDWEGNTFTISNLGMFGIDEFTAIINAPDSCIMAVGGIKQTPVVKDGAIVPGNVMKVTMSCDHRVVDGATGADFLKTFKGILENPLKMLL